MPKFSQRSKDAMEGLHPKLIALLNAAIINSPVDFTVTEGIRTAKRQNEIFKSNPKATNKDGYIRKSNHQVKSDGYGHAFDIYPYYNGSVQTGSGMNRTQLNELNSKQKILADHMRDIAKSLNIKITRGIDWKSPYDPPHFELS